MLKRRVISFLVMLTMIMSIAGSFTVSAVSYDKTYYATKAMWLYSANGANTVTIPGSATGDMLVSKNGSGTVYRNSYMKFDISDVKDTINSAKLTLFVNLKDNLTTPLNLNVLSYEVEWPENVTAENIPAIPADSKAVADPVSVARQANYYAVEVDITDYVKSLDKKEVSLAFTGNSSSQIMMSRFDAPVARRPYLKLTCDDGKPVLQNTLTYDFSDYKDKNAGELSSFFDRANADAIANDEATGSYRTVKPALGYGGKAADDASVMMESHLIGDKIQQQTIDKKDYMVWVEDEESEPRKLFQAGPYLDNSSLPFRWNLQDGTVTHLSFNFAFEGGFNYRRYLNVRMRNSAGTTDNIVPFWTEGNRVYFFKRQVHNVKLEEGSWNKVDVFLERDKSARLFVNGIEADIRDKVERNADGSYKLLPGMNDDKSSNYDIFTTMVGFRFGCYERVDYEEDTKSLIDDIVIRELYPEDVKAVTDGIIATNPEVVKFSTAFGNDMVFQRNKPINVWGYAKAGTEVKVTLGETEKIVAANENGKWTASFDAMSAQTGLTLSVVNTADENDKQVLTNVAVGEVIFCGGQSNMQYALEKIKDADTIISEVDNYDIRVLDPGDRQGEYYALDESLQFSWYKVDSENAGGVTAIGYIAAMNLIKNGTVDCPIGLISFNRSGSKIQPWLDDETIRSREEYAELVEEFEAAKEACSLLRNTSAAKVTAKVLYNAMISPIKDMQIGGVLWYQGESNSDDPYLYNYLLADYINMMRKTFEDEELPFVMVSLAPYNEATSKSWGDLRQAQLDTAKRMEKVAVVSTANEGPTGIPGEDPIHPMNKIPVAERVAGAYAALKFGVESDWQGPVYESMKLEGNKAILTFSYADGGLVCNGDTLTGFTVSADGESFVPATAVINGNTVEVSGIDNIVEVRYCYGVAVDANGTLGGNLTNASGVGALPFRATKENAAIVTVTPNEATKEELKDGITINCTIDNLGYTAASQTAVVAVYEGNTLKTCKLYETYAPTVERNSYDFQIDADASENVSCSVMLFDDLTNIIPFGSKDIVIK